MFVLAWQYIEAILSHITYPETIAIEAVISPASRAMGEEILYICFVRDPLQILRCSVGLSRNGLAFPVESLTNKIESYDGGHVHNSENQNSLQNL